MPNVFATEQSLLAEQFPALREAKVYLSSSRLTLFGDTYQAVSSRVEHLQNEEGYFPEAACEMAISEACTSMSAPEGHQFLGLELQDGSKTLVMVRIGG